MATKWRFAAAAVVVLTVLLAGWWLMESGRGGGAVAERPADAPTRPRRHAAAPPKTGTRAAGPDPAIAAAEPPEAPGRARGLLRGVVLMTDGHTPVAGAEVRIEPFGGHAPDGMTPPVVPLRRRVARCDGAGRFVVDEVPAGAWRLVVEQAGLGRAEGVGIAGVDPPWAELLIEAPTSETSAPLRVRVFDPAGEPVPGARVTAVSTRDTPFAVTTTDADGRAVVNALPSGGSLIVAATGTAAVRATVWNEVGYRRADMHLDRQAMRAWLDFDEELRLTLLPTGSLRGRVRRPDGSAAAGTVVEAWVFTFERHGLPTTALHYEAAAADDGAYVLPTLPPGPYKLLARNAHGDHVPSRIATEAQRDQGPYLELPHVDITPGGETRWDLDLVPGGTIRGRVRRVDGSPVVGARVECHLPLGPTGRAERWTIAGIACALGSEKPWPDDRRHPATWFVASTAADGAYEVRGLPPAGSWRVRVVPSPELTFDLRDPVAVESGRVTELDHRVEPAGTLEALLPASASFALRPAGAASARASLSTPYTGAVVVPGLAAGEWELLAFAKGRRDDLVCVRRFTIEAGRTSFLDAADAGRDTIRVRFVANGLPCPGVAVRVPSSRGLIYSDADGVACLREVADGYPFQFRSAGPDGTWHDVAPTLQPLDGGVWQAEVAVPTGRIGFRATDVRGRPASGVMVGLSSEWGAQQRSRPTDEAGAVTFSDVRVGEYNWTAEFPDGCVRRGDVNVGEEMQWISLAGEETGSLRVLVLLADGRPAAGARVSVELLRDERDPGASAPDRWSRAESALNRFRRWTDGDGVFLVRGVGRGLAQVRASPRSRMPGLPGGRWSDPAEVRTAPPGEVSVTVRLPVER